jgi:hypothetical protein
MIAKKHMVRKKPLASITINLCKECEYYQEPHEENPERSMFECLVCKDWFCDECHEEHAMWECFNW